MAPPTESFPLAPAAILELGERPTVYLTAPDERVEAVDGITGKVRWRSAKLGFVLAAGGGKALALRRPGPPERGGCQPVLVDSRNGRILGDVKVEGGSFPGCPGEGINASMTVAPFTRNGDSYLGWVSRWWPTPGGAYRGPTYQYPPGSSGTRQGAYAVDFLRGVLTVAASAYADDVAAIRQNAIASGATVLVDGLSATTDRRLEQGQVVHLILHRWRGPDPLPEVDLGTPPWNSCGTSFTADHRHVLAVWQVPERHDPFLYHVRVFTVATGAMLAELDSTSWPAVAAVSGSTLVAWFPDRVFATDLKTGREIWTRPVRDLRYHGSYPPSAAR